MRVWLQPTWHLEPLWNEELLATQIRVSQNLETKLCDLEYNSKDQRTTNGKFLCCLLQDMYVWLYQRACEIIFSLRFYLYHVKPKRIKKKQLTKTYYVASVSTKCVHMYVCLHRDVCAYIEMAPIWVGVGAGLCMGPLWGESAPLFVDQVRHGVTNQEK